MKIPRLRRYEHFQMFFENAKDRFDKLAKDDPRNEVFNNRYSLHILPGGSDGGTNDRIVEIFYGKRPFDRTVRGLSAESGTGLFYERNDRGNVQCILYPATTDNFRQQESAILLDMIYEPQELIGLAKTESHWKYFVAYMQVTSLDGEPSMWDKLLIGWLRLSKRMIVDEKVQESRLWYNTKLVIKYAFTIGLSGFLLIGFSTCSDKYSRDHRQHIEHHR